MNQAGTYPAVLRRDHALVRQAVTYSGDDGVPPALFFGRIIDQDAIHIPRGLVAAIVPNSVFADARHNEEAWCDPLVEDARWWILLRQERCRRVVTRIRNRLNCQICSAVFRIEPAPNAAIRQLGFLSEDRYRNFSARPGTHYDKSLPLGTERWAGYGSEAENNRG